MQSSIFFVGNEQGLSHIYYQADKIDAHKKNQIIEFTKNAHFKQSFFWFESHKKDMIAALSFQKNCLCALSFIEIKSSPWNLTKILRINRGPVFIEIEILKQHLHSLIQFAQNTKSAWIEISPFLELDKNLNIFSMLCKTGWKPIKNIRENYKNTVVIDIQQELKIIRSSFRRSLKTQINKALKSFIEIDKQLNHHSLIQFLSMYNSMAQIRGLAPFTQSDLHFLLNFNENHSKNIIILNAIFNEEFIGGIILIRVGNTYIYEWGVSSEEEKHRKLPISHLLHWRAIEIIKKLDASQYDLGGYWLERGDSDPINRFKTGFSKCIIDYFPEFIYTVNFPKSWMISKLQALRDKVK